MRACVEEKVFRKQLFDILRRRNYVVAFLDKLRELDLYDYFAEVCEELYIQIFEEWADRNGLDFKSGKVKRCLREQQTFSSFKS